MGPKTNVLILAGALVTSFCVHAQSMDARDKVQKPKVEKAKTAAAYSYSSPAQKVLQSKDALLKGKYDGGVATGGGDVIPSYNVAPSEIRGYIQESKLPVLHALRHLEVLSLATFSPDAWNGMQFRTALSKLFGGGTTVYQTLKLVQFQLLEAGPCLDRDGSKKDASVQSATQICFSLQRLAQNLNQDSVQSQIIALIVHEVSHLLGTTEEEAVVLQLMVKSSVVNDVFRKIKEDVKDYRERIRDVKSNLITLIDQLDDLKNEEVCFAVSFKIMPVSELLFINIKNQNGVAMSSRNEIIFLNGVLLKALNLTTFCMANMPAYQKIKDVYKGREEISLIEAQKTLYPDVKGMLPVPDWRVRKIEQGDKQNLKIEILDMINRLTQVDDKI